MVEEGGEWDKIVGEFSENECTIDQRTPYCRRADQSRETPALCRGTIQSIMRALSTDEYERQLYWRIGRFRVF